MPSGSPRLTSLINHQRMPSPQIDRVDVDDEFDAAVGWEGGAEIPPQDADGVQVDC